MGVANSFFGTKVILNFDLPEVEMYKKKYGVVTYKYMIFEHFYAWPWLTTLRILFVDRMDSADVQLTQGVSMMSSYSARPVAEELLETMRMTIEDLIECHQVIDYDIALEMMKGLWSVIQ
jgi:hypothetical protein